MCRLTCYKGRPLLIGDLVTRPDNSLLFQSRHAAYHPGVIDETHRRNILVNGDGFGVAWYSENGTRGSCCFKFVTPAWSNGNLRNIGEHVSSHLIFAHIRAASSGHDPHERTAVSNENCHPFKYGKYTFMHNGGIPSFSKIKRQVLNLLSERVYQDIKGSTDSEHMFAVFLDYVLPLDESINGGGPSSTDKNQCRSRANSLEEELSRNRSHTVEATTNSDISHMITAVNKMISTFVNLCASAGIAEPISINLVVSDGTHIIATRFRSGTQNPPSLYFNYGSDFVCDDGNFYSSGDLSQRAESIVISSAPLSRVRRCKYTGEQNCVSKPISCGGSIGGGSSVGGSVDGSDTNNNSDNEGTSLETMDEHNGSWVLMPKDTMLVCRGDPDNNHNVLSIQILPIEITDDQGPMSPSRGIGGSNCVFTAAVASALTVAASASMKPPLSGCSREEGKNRFNFCKLKKRTSFKGDKEKTYADATAAGVALAFKPQVVKLRSKL